MLAKGLFSALMNWDDVDTEVMTTTTVYYLATEYLFNVLPKQRSRASKYKLLSEVSEPTDDGMYVLTNAGRKQLFLLFRDKSKKTILLFDMLQCTAQFCADDTRAYQYEIVHSNAAKWESLNAIKPDLVWNLKASSVLLVVQLLSIDAEKVVAKKPHNKDCTTFLKFVKDVLDIIPDKIDSNDISTTKVDPTPLKRLAIEDVRLNAISTTAMPGLVQSVLDIFSTRHWTFGLKLHATFNDTTKTYDIYYYCP